MWVGGMGTKVDCKSYLTGYNNNYYNSMRDLNEDSSSNSWPACYGDNNTTTNGPYYNGFMPRAIADGYPGYGKDALKQKMLEHEAIFKNQVYELHRLYRIQIDMMEEFKRKELYRLQTSMEPSSSTNLRPQILSQDPRKLHTVAFPQINSGYENRMSISRAEIENSPLSCTKGYNTAKPSKEYETSDLRPLKVRKQLFHLQLPADEYIDTQESEKKVSAGTRLADLNEPIEIEETMTLSTVDFLDHNLVNGVKRVENRVENRDGPLVKSSVNERGFNERGWLSHLHETGPSKSNLSSVTHGLHKEKMGMPSHPAPGTLNRGADPGPLLGSSYFASRPHSVASWGNPMSSFTQKLTTTESLLDPPRNMHTLAQLGEKWLVNGSSSLNPISGGEMAAENGFYHGSASKLNGKTNLRSANHVFWNNSKPVIEIDLNEAEDRPLVLPWLKPGLTHAKRPTFTDLNEPSSDCEIIEPTTKETQNVKKILGVPIFQMEKLCPSSEKRSGIMKIDINLECEPQDEEIPPDRLAVENEVKKMEGSFIRDYIDLNSCVGDFEEENDLSVKIVSGIDLDQEAPVENEDIEASFQLLQIKKNETLNAAEIMIAISSSCQGINKSRPLDDGATPAESLIRFVDAVLDEVEKSTDGNQSLIEEKDDFEEMTLLIRETKEDYMPAPFVPEEVVLATNSTLGTRPRRGQPRRGRQRRDFQRDILPGLVSLSRLEVTEDIQMFSGLMRATGLHWVSGLARRNSGGRGRRRTAAESVPAFSGANNRACQALLVGQISNKGVEGVGLEDRSLTGWGKTTRRPRRQRCPTGSNNPPVLT